MMAIAPEREAWITGIGLVSALGEGLDAHWEALHGDREAWLKLDSTTHAPYQVHPAVALDLAKQIPDRRATAARWRAGSASAPTPPASRWRMPGSRARTTS
jgi:3-oxoacyl-[acyl-carrier-protein] synthase II